MKFRLRLHRFRLALAPSLIQCLRVISQALCVRKIAQLDRLKASRHQLMQTHCGLACTGAAGQKQRLSFAAYAIILLLAEVQLPVAPAFFHQTRQAFIGRQIPSGGIQNLRHIAPILLAATQGLALSGFFVGFFAKSRFLSPGNRRLRLQGDASPHLLVMLAVLQQHHAVRSHLPTQTRDIPGIQKQNSIPAVDAKFINRPRAALERADIHPFGLGKQRPGKSGQILRQPRGDKSPFFQRHAFPKIAGYQLPALLRQSPTLLAMQKKESQRRHAAFPHFSLL